MSRKSASATPAGRSTAAAARTGGESSLQVPGLAPEEAGPAVLLAVLLLALFWSYWNTLCEVAACWDNELYSHGYLVPAFAVVILWVRRTWVFTGLFGVEDSRVRQPLRSAEPWARWAGLHLLAAGLILRLTCTRFGVVTAEMVSFVPSLAGVVLLAGGWSLFRWAGPAVGFLIFMFPVPSFVKDQILVRLQNLATVASTYVLQTLGVAAYRDGNLIRIGETQMGVVEACSGLKMATNLVALVVAVLLITRRPWWQRLVLLLSALPIAVAANVVRITATSLTHLATDAEWIHEFVHNYVAGYGMMILGLALVCLEMFVLDHLLLEDETEDSELAAAGLGIRPAASSPVAGGAAAGGATG